MLIIPWSLFSEKIIQSARCVSPVSRMSLTSLMLSRSCQLTFNMIPGMAKFDGAWTSDGSWLFLGLLEAITVWPAGVSGHWPGG